MKKVIFAKKLVSEGKIFYNYFCKIVRKADGEVITAKVGFRKNVTKPDPVDCPMIIDVDEKTSSVSNKKFTDKNGNVGTSYTLWVGGWEFVEPYVDNSIDDFE